MIRIWPFSKIHITPPDEAARRDRYVEVNLEDAIRARDETRQMLERSNRIRAQLVAHNEANAYGLWMESILAKNMRRRNP